MKRLQARFGRALLLLLLVAFGTLLLVRYAPGYFTDAREMDAQYAAVARAEVSARYSSDGSAFTMLRTVAGGWLHGNFGMSRQYGIPVADLIRPRWPVTLRLLGEALVLGWLAASSGALYTCTRQSRAGRIWIASGSALLLAVPIGALSTVFLLTNTGGPVLAIAIPLAARDFKFLHQLLTRQWREPSLLFARAQGIPARSLVTAYLLAPLAVELLSLAGMSFVLALSMAIPAEVLFSVPGLGQLAWSAAGNRDLPLLLAITLLMAGAVAFSGLLGKVHGTGMEAELA